ncbi:hypothetical protein V6N13_060212 [Hibiscus sabdariffa]|uniref:MADS-box domain-containing protein n=1 Tax=Hibiscus sabdariffa TaxID=183260 RepID=A0ABR2GBV1_9ROSI
MEAAGPSRKGCGRRKIDIKKIEDQRKLWVAFSKRKKGLLSKADRLSRMSGEDIGIVIISEQGRVYTSDNADAVIHRYLSIVRDKNDDDAGVAKDDAGSITHPYRSRRIVKEQQEQCDDMTISKFKPLSLKYKHGVLTITDDDGHVSYKNADNDGKSKNEKAAEEQTLNMLVDGLKIRDEEIRGKDCLIDLNKTPDDELSLKWFLY